MSVYGRLNAVSGQLTEMRYAASPVYPDDVPLLAMPGGFGPYGYDAVNQVAIPLPAAKQTDAQKIGNVAMDGRTVLALLTLRTSTQWAAVPAAVQQRVQAAIDNSAAAIIAALEAT